jgi:DNA-binding response OmpR family regulator
MLLVNDSATVNRILKRNFESEGFFVDTAATGREGIARAREKRYDIILLDYNLPDMNGDEVCMAIKGAGGAPVYFISAMDKGAMDKVIADTGARGWFDITADVEDAVKKIRALVGP